MAVWMNWTMTIGLLFSPMPETMRPLMTSPASSIFHSSTCGKWAQKKQPREACGCSRLHASIISVHAREPSPICKHAARANCAPQLRRASFMQEGLVAARCLPHLPTPRYHRFSPIRPWISSLCYSVPSCGARWLTVTESLSGDPRKPLSLQLKRPLVWP